MIVKTKISLKPYNTFGIDVNAADFIDKIDQRKVKKVVSDKPELPF